MKKMVILVIVLFSGCVSFKIPIPEESEEMVDYLAICKKINKEANFEKEILSEIVEKTDPSVYALIKVLYISRPLQLQWKWYNPKEELVKLSKILDVNKNEKYLEYFVAWDTLSNEYFKDNPGKWTVIVLCKEQFFYKKEFEVR